MFIGVWNKSVILTYIGLFFSVIGMYLAFTNENILYAFSCLMVSGVCDLFDGKVARMCKRTEKTVFHFFSFDRPPKKGEVHGKKRHFHKALTKK